MKHFKKYNELLNEITELEYKIITLKDRLYSISGVRYDDMPKASGSGTDIVFKLQEIEELIHDLNILKDRKKVLYDKHLKEIGCLENERQMAIMRCYYLHKMSIQEIADLYHLSPKHVLKVKRIATKRFTSKMIPNDTK